MRLSILILVLIATLFGSGFWYDYIDTTCRVPIHYRIGNVDERFGTSAEEIMRIAKNAEKVWEAPLAAELFVYDAAETSLPINFVFDERQETADREAELRADLEAKEGMSEDVASQYEKLISEFRTLKKKYEARVVSYEESLKKYNTTVQSWNDKGGAPPGVISSLQEEEADLKKEQGELEILSKQLNSFVSKLNTIGARGNELITDYNGIVEKYNSEFDTEREFAQGEYAQQVINVYQFDSEDELTIVLAHEFGHALSFGHVENDRSVMYHLMGKQTIVRGISKEDIAEYTQRCTQKTFFQKAARFVADTFAL